MKSHLELNEQQKTIINRLQLEIPIVAEPFKAVADELGMTESHLLEQIQILKRDFLIIRQLSAIFDTRNLGYTSSLVALAAPEDKFIEAARVVNRHPGVSHNYQRSHKFNMWYTIALPKNVSLEESVQLIQERAGGEHSLILPTLRMYKIAVRLDMSGGKDEEFKEAQKKITHKENVAFNPTQYDIDCVRQLQQDMPLVSRPYKGYAEAIGISEDQLLETANHYQDIGIMRRFSAVLRHHKAGFSYNVMVVWKVPEDRWEEVGMTMAVAPNVSHCYRRPTYGDLWPYTHFTMVHGQSKEMCDETIAWIQDKTGLQEHDCLVSLKELKKIRLKYYVPELDDWLPEKFKSPALV